MLQRIVMGESKAMEWDGMQCEWMERMIENGNELDGMEGDGDAMSSCSSIMPFGFGSHHSV